MCKIRKMQRQCGIYIFFFFPNLFSEGNYPVEGFGYVSTIIYITASASGCCLPLVHAQHSLLRVTEGDPAKMCSQTGPEFMLRNTVISPGRI